MISLFSTQIRIGNSILSKIEPNGKTIVIADQKIKDLYATKLADQLKAELLLIPSGEKTKGQETALELIEELSKIKAEKETTLVAIGGGMTTDLVGFVASIYKRGIPLIFIPTTLLAIVDASIGGKTAINTSFGKNLIGTFYYPKAIYSDLDTLKTLPESEWFNGFAEIIKMALIYDASIWEVAIKNKKNPLLIFKAIQAKVAIVEKDPLEKALRRILNFGHTIGHALEKSTNYEIAHGEAVALGCLAESFLSMHLGYLKKMDFEQILRMYHGFSLKLPKSYVRSKCFQALSHDKKRSLGEMRFVLIDKIGHALPFDGAYCRNVLPDELTTALDWMENYA